MKIITVFGSALPKPTDEEYLTAYKLGRLIGEANLGVCSGGYGGIMEAVSKGCTEAGGEAIGVTVKSFTRSPNSYLTRVVETDTLFERIEKLIGLGDAFIVLRGGTGTLLELATVWEFFNKNFLKVKPVAAHGEMWKPIVEEIEKRLSYENRKTGLVKWFAEIEDAFDFVASRI